MATRHTLPPTSSYPLEHVMQAAEQGFVWAANELRDRGVVTQLSANRYELATVEDVRRMDATLARMREQEIMEARCPGAWEQPSDKTHFVATADGHSRFMIECSVCGEQFNVNSRNQNRVPYHVITAD